MDTKLNQEAENDKDMKTNTNFTADQTQNPESIYYLHPSNSANTKLVFVVFDGTCYSDWKRSMMIGLDAKNIMCFMDGSLPQPEDNTPDERAWKRCNNMVIGWIISYIERKIAKSFIYLKTASCIWKDLEGRTPSSSHMYRLQEKPLNTTHGPEMTIVEYFTKVKSLWDEIDDLRPLPLCNCHPTTNFVMIPQDQRLITFHMKLDPQNSQVRTNVLLRKDMPDVREVYRMLL
ncbi:uncharacterized protein LOC130805716 [Amaranthus tricolor]|uniref:uncharacterized protein LOC130805716 n=1 Tax=Amaranthus tricolor TaxID=29722 RepID=UPI00258B3020|nr:uncharacterized protein LOC130805716 [Amaranthus tricolor]